MVTKLNQVKKHRLWLQQHRLCSSYKQMSRAKATNYDVQISSETVGCVMVDLRMIQVTTG